MRASTRWTTSSMAASETDGSDREKRAGWDCSAESRAENALAIETVSVPPAGLTSSDAGTAIEDSGSTIGAGSASVGAGFFGMSQSPNDAGFDAGGAWWTSLWDPSKPPPCGMGLDSLDTAERGCTNC